MCGMTHALCVMERMRPASSRCGGGLHHTKDRLKSSALGALSSFAGGMHPMTTYRGPRWPQPYATSFLSSGQSPDRSLGVLSARCDRHSHMSYARLMREIPEMRAHGCVRFTGRERPFSGVRF